MDVFGSRTKLAAGRSEEREGCGVGRVIFLGSGGPLNEERAQASLAVPLSRGEATLSTPQAAPSCSGNGRAPASR
jgi:hypothetical protein